MSFTIPDVDVGEPHGHDSLLVFPLFNKARSNVDCVLAEEAISKPLVSVREVSESGSVPDLIAENYDDERVFFIESDELIGAK